DVVGCYRRHRVKVAVGAGHDAPTCAVPVLGQRPLGATAVVVFSDGPDVVGRHRHNSIELDRARAGAGHDAPTCAVPVLGQRLVCAGVFTGVTDGPDVVGRASCGGYPVEDAGAAHVGA